VRAYAGRGLIPKPRLVGRTGYYGPEHVARLRLIQDLLGRGYTLSAVERVIHNAPAVAAGHALELLQTLSWPQGLFLEEQPIVEEMSVEQLSRLAGVEHDEEVLERLMDAGLVERTRPGQVRVLHPAVVRAGAQAMSLGLSREAVLGLFPLLSEHLHVVAKRFVDEFRDQLWRPFVEAGFPEEEWPDILGRIEAILPVAGQAVLAVFRDELRSAVEEAMGEEIQQMAQAEASREAAR
jgi:DNA-binding transcriptional MerR regulator